MNLDALEAAVADEAIPQWLRTGLQRWAASGGAASLTQCLALPCTPRQFAIEERNRWLRIARRHVGSTAELQGILERLHWRLPIWARRGCPARLTPVEAALFNASECAELPTSAKQLARIVGHGSPRPVSGTDC